MCRAVREHARGEHACIVLDTARSQADDLEQVLAAGADDYLPKPATPSDVAARLRDAKEHGSVEYARGQRMVDLGDRRGQVP